jgi:hypothetical protein
MAVRMIRQALILALAAVLSPACRLPSRTVLSVASPKGDTSASVTENPLLNSLRQALWVHVGGRPQLVMGLSKKSHACEQIVWSADGDVVLFVAEGRGSRFGVIVRGIVDEPSRRLHISRVTLDRLRSGRDIRVDGFGRVSVPVEDGPADNPLWAPPSASVDVGLYADGTSDLHLTIRATIAKESTTNALTSHFARLGWTEQTFEWLNPTTPTSFTTGWRDGRGGVVPTDGQGRRLRQPTVHLWSGEWKNPQGDLIRYYLTSIDGEVRGSGVHYPGKILEAQIARLHGG